MAKTGLIRKRSVRKSTKSGIDLNQIFALILRRRFFIFGVSCMVVSMTTVGVLTTKPIYRSDMQIIVSSNLNQRLLTNETLPEQRNGLNDFHNDFHIPPVDYITQVRLMESSKLVQKAILLLRADYPNITIEDIKGNNTTGKKASLEVTPSADNSAKNQSFSRIFIVSFKDHHPRKTQRVLQALEKVYQDYNIEQKKQRLSQGMAFINNRISQVQKDLIESEKKLAHFRKQHNLLDPVAASKVLLESMGNIQKQRQTIQTQLQDIQTRYNKLVKTLNSQNIKNSSDLSVSVADQALLSEIKKTQIALDKERLLYQDDYPTVEKLKQQYQTQLALLHQQQQSQGKNNKAMELVQVDPKSFSELTKLQTMALGLIANENDLAKSEQTVRLELNLYPSLITEYNNLISNIAVQQKTLDKLLLAQQSWEMKISQTGFDWQIIAEPDLGIYIGNRQWLFIISGLLIGPFLGIIIALISEFFNQAIFSAYDLQKLTNLQLLGSVPQLFPFNLKNTLGYLFRRKQLNSNPCLTVTSKIKLPSRKTLDIIYQNILISRNALAVKSLMLTSATPREGKTTIILGLGTSAAHMHQRVLIIDANFQSPSLHKILELSNDWGLSLLLVDEVDLETDDYVQHYIQPIHPSIDILTAGPIPEDTVNLLSSHRMQKLINSFTQIYDIVLIDAPAILGTVDTRILASLCQGVVIVGRIGQINRHKLVQATDILSKLNLIGIIANNEGRG